MSIGGLSGLGAGRMPDFSAMREKMFQKADANGDSALSLQEFQEAGTKLPIGKGMSAEKAKEAFGKMDGDGNGSLSQDEMRTFRDRMSSQMQGAMVDLQAMMGGGQGAGGMGAGMPDPMAIFGEADEDKNGAISRAEFGKSGPGSASGSSMSDEQMNAVFGAIDGDGDGSLTQDELKQFGDQMKRQAESLMGSASAQFQQALGAYRQGQQQQSDLTSVLLKALDGNKGVQA